MSRLRAKAEFRNARSNNECIDKLVGSSSRVDLLGVSTRNQETVTAILKAVDKDFSVSERLECVLDRAKDSSIDERIQRESNGTPEVPPLVKVRSRRDG